MTRAMFLALASLCVGLLAVSCGDDDDSGGGGETDTDADTDTDTDSDSDSDTDTGTDTDSCDNPNCDFDTYVCIYSPADIEQAVGCTSVNPGIEVECPTLTNLAGLECLQQVGNDGGGGLEIWFCDSLVDVSALSGLISVNEYLNIDTNLVLPSVSWPVLTSVGELYIGGDGLGRMLGLWIEQEAMVRGAANRELALEVASLRLARWPSVRRVEEWLAGTVEPGHGPLDSSSGSGAPRSSQSSPATSGGAAPTESRSQEAASPKSAENDDPLAEEAGSDPGVILATRVLGGEVVRVRSDGDGS